MVLVRHLVEFLQQQAPVELAQDWDNVGLLLGSQDQPVVRVMTCLTLTLSVAEEAVDRGAHLVLTHHPIPFRPLDRITDETPTGEVLWLLARSGVCVYSAHTAFDDAPGGINDQLAQALELIQVEPLVPQAEGNLSGQGTGRVGRLPQPLPLATLAQRVKDILKIQQLQAVGDPQRQVQQVAIVCGSGGQLLPDVVARGCEVFLTGEMRFHACLEALAQRICVLLPGHYATERFAMENLAQQVAQRFPELEVWASQVERDPLYWL